MSRTRRFEHRFVKSVPKPMDEGILYVSLEYSTAIHLCACGCGNQVVTPLAPRHWSMTYDGASVALFPSIGNWNFPCRSHYFIASGGEVRWARTWSDEEVARARVGRSPEALPSPTRTWLGKIRGWLARLGP